MTGKYEVKDLDGVNCAIVESGVGPARADFLKRILVHNGYQVHIVENSPPKPAAEEPSAALISEPLYTIGVTDITFNISLALFGRHLQTLDNSVLLPHYWQTGRAGAEYYWKEPALIQG
jgi:hypothetical protein